MKKRLQCWWNGHKWLSLRKFTTTEVENYLDRREIVHYWKTRSYVHHWDKRQCSHCGKIKTFKV